MSPAYQMGRDSLRFQHCNGSTPPEWVVPNARESPISPLHRFSSQTAAPLSTHQETHSLRLDAQLSPSSVCVIRATARTGPYSLEHRQRDAARRKWFGAHRGYAWAAKHARSSCPEPECRRLLPVARLLRQFPSRAFQIARRCSATRVVYRERIADIHHRNRRDKCRHSNKDIHEDAVLPDAIVWWSLGANCL